MAYHAYTVTDATTGERRGMVEAQGPEEAVFRLFGGEWGRADLRAWRAHEAPCALSGFTSYRYRGPYGWVTIGAMDDADALRQAARSVFGEVERVRLEVWTPGGYQPLA